MFFENGYEGTTTREVAAAMGMSKANLYYHFPAKEELLRALLGALFGRVEVLLSRHLPTPNGSPEQRELLEEYFDVMLENPRLMALLASDAGALSAVGVGDRVVDLNDRLVALVAGSEPGVEGQVKAACALGTLQTAAVRFYQADPGAVPRAGLAAAFAVLWVE